MISDADDYDAVVYDLDGTLVSLDVDWDAVAADVAAALRTRGVEVDGDDLWAMLERAEGTDHEATVEATIAEHEREGARNSRRLPPADDLPDLPVGVCSLNCEAACRIALDVHGLDGAVDVVVGRDTAATHKPEPESLLAAVRALETAPERTLFVGDSERDAVTAERAGVPFAYVTGEQPDR